MGVGVNTLFVQIWGMACRFDHDHWNPNVWSAIWTSAAISCGRQAHVHFAVTEKTLKCQWSLIKITKCISLFIFFTKYFDYCLLKRRSLKNIRGSLRAKLSHNLQKNSMKGKADYSMPMVSFSWRQFIFCWKCSKIHCEKDKKNKHPKHNFKCYLSLWNYFCIVVKYPKSLCNSWNFIL